MDWKITICDSCAGTGKDVNGMGGYCNICGGHPEIDIHNPDNDKSWATPWKLIEDRKQLRNEWIEFKEEHGMREWDHYREPFEYPCLAKFFIRSCADSSGSFVDFIYKSDADKLKDK